jgi:putative colanic acid biosynthesis UDP-glucose lipid carrier transferase
MNELIHNRAPRLAWAVRLADVLVLQITGQWSAALCLGTPLLQAAPVHAVVLYFCCSLAFLLLPGPGPHGAGEGRPMPQLLLRLASTWGGVLLAGLVFSMPLHLVGTLSRPWLGCWFALGLTALCAARMLARATLHYLHKIGLKKRRVLLIGYGPVGRELHRRARSQPWLGYHVAALQGEPGGADDVPDALTVVAPADTVGYVTSQTVDEIWCTLPLSAAARLHELQAMLHLAPVSIRWMPDTSGDDLAGRRLADFLGFQAIYLAPSGAASVNAWAKDAFDRVFAMGALIALAPLLAVIAVGIKCSSPGPVFFRQPRNGLHGKPFSVYKFRSMRLHQEAGPLIQASRNDPRLSRIGHFLRRTSLDELPQFINVLRGEMSVVGPRPHALQHNDLYQELVASYRLRLRVKPGMTGWAQMHGHRGATDTVEKMALRVQFDLDYIQHWSLWLDLRIIAWTAVLGWTDKNAY